LRIATAEDGGGAFSHLGVLCVTDGLTLKDGFKV
jgi:hypothetical protein